MRRAERHAATDELLREVDRRRLPGVDEEALRRFVDQCDVARYARFEVPVPACGTALAFARGLVESTRPRPPPATPQPPAGSEVAPA